MRALRYWLLITAVLAFGAPAWAQGAANNAAADDFVVIKVDKTMPLSNFLDAIGEVGKRDGQFNCPTALAIDPYGYVFVVDTLNNRIQKFDPDLNFVSKWGSIGREAKEFRNPSGIGLSWEPDWAPKD